MKQTIAEEPEWATKLEQWDTEKEIRQIGHAKKMNYNRELLDITKN